MTESDWQTCDDPDVLLRFIAPRLSRQQIILFACGCCRRLWDYVGDDTCGRW